MRIWGLFVVSVVGCREGLGGWGVVCMCVYDWGERGRRLSGFPSSPSFVFGEESPSFL